MFDEKANSKRLKVAMAIYVALFVPGYYAFFALYALAHANSPIISDSVHLALFGTVLLYPCLVFTAMLLGYWGLGVESVRALRIAERLPVFMAVTSFCIFLSYFSIRW